MNETDPNAPFHRIFKDTSKFGVRIPNGFNGSQKEIIDMLFEMSSFTIQEQKLYYGWTITLERSPVGEWRFSLEPKDKNE